MKYDNEKPSREEEIANRMGGMMLEDKLIIIEAIENNIEAPSEGEPSVVSPEVLYSYCVDNTRI